MFYLPEVSSDNPSPLAYNLHFLAGYFYETFFSFMFNIASPPVEGAFDVSYVGSCDMGVYFCCL